MAATIEEKIRARLQHEDLRLLEDFLNAPLSKVREIIDKMAEEAMRG